MRSDAGFTLLESLVAMALTLLVAGAALTLVAPNQAAFQAQPEAVDVQERLRGATAILARELSMAGAGLDSGEDPGGLIERFAPVVPRRLGRRGDAAGVARSDALTITYVPSARAQAITAVAVPDAAGVRVEDEPGCPSGRAVCGLAAGMTVAVFDRMARHDFFTITDIEADVAQLRAHASSTANVFSPGAFVAQVESHSYYLDAARRQLRTYDGDATDVPVADNVVDLAFEYFGDPLPPRSPVPPEGAENCLYDAAGQLRPAAVLSADRTGLAPLPLSMLNDGPWCGAGETRFDADLLRVRAVRVSVRVQATLAAFRAAGPEFRQPGSSRTSARYLPDAAITMLIVPRNLVRSP